MKSKLYARIVCVVLAVAIIGSILIVAVPMLSGRAAVTPVKGAIGHITDDYVNLRSGAGTNYSVVTSMRLNTKVTFVDGSLYNSDWYKITELSTSKTGYVRKDFVVADSVPASRIKISATSASTYVGCQYAFWQTGANSPKWSSSNTSVATIDSNGVLTAKAAGTVTITVSESGESATCKFTVHKGNATGISNSSLTVYKGKTATLTAKTSGVKWYSSNRNVASVSNGVVTAKDYGYATISAYTSSGASTCLIHVTDPPQSTKIRLSSYAPATFTGCQYAFGITGATNPTWTSSDTSVATVNASGVVTAKKAGKTVISATEGNETAYCTFTVVSGGATGISDASMALITGTTGRLTSTTSGVKWYSSNPKVASVDGGVVTAVSEGYATISAYTSSGASTCLVSVTDKALQSDLTLSSAQITTYAGCQYALWQTGVPNALWKSSDSNVATIDSNGVITTKTAGMATITAAGNGLVSSAKLIVKPANSTGISNTSLTMEEGNTVTLTAKTSGVGWFSSNKTVATVSNGKVTAKSEGFTTISAYTSSGASTCLVQVIKPEVDEKVGYITEDGVNLRSGAGTNYSVLKNMSKNTRIVFLSDTLYNSSWYNVKLDDGTKGYVIKDYVSKPAEITLTATSATTYVGCQYAFGFSGVNQVIWASSNSSVASIDANGVLTAKAAGTTTVTAGSGSSKASCKVTVKTGTSTGISNTSITLDQGKTAKLTAKTAGVGWFSSNKNVATVNGGVVTAKGIGYATISAYTSSGASTCLVKVNEGSGTIKLTTSSATTYVGCQYAIGLKGVSKASWSSSNTNIATVDANGVVTAKAAGTATIRAANSASSANCVITVKSGYDTGISAASVTIAAGKSILLKANSGVKWYSSNSSIATVDSGIVDTKASGYVTISAYTNSGASTCLLHVTAPDSIRFVYATPNSAPKNSTVTFKAITDKTRTAVKFEVTNGSTTYTVNATNKVSDGNTYIWTGSRALGTSGKWTIKAYSKTSTADYATTSGNGSGEVFVTNSTDTTTTVTGERRASDQIIDLIANYEGFLTSVTPDSITSDPTLGYGKVVTRNEQFYNNLTKNEAYGYLCQTVNSGGYTTKTNEFLTTHNVKFNQRQFDALVCFAYNVGAYTIYNDSTLQSILLSSSGSSGTIKAGGAGYVNGAGVNLRSGAGTNYSIVTTMSQNTSFTFVDAALYNTYWYKIKLSNGTVGYIHKDYAAAAGSSSCDLANVNKQSLLSRFLQYHHAASSCYWGLLYRRIDEMEIFFYGDYARDGQYNKYGFYYRCPNNSSFGIG